MLIRHIDMILQFNPSKVQTPGDDDQKKY
uniref:Uncharacterized protein n=1 Tax=Arundo donax TaxID=35708 RepID=A0A0A9B960_ARUDO